MLVHGKLCIHENDHIYLRKNIYKKCEMGCDVLDAMVVRFTSTYVGLLCPWSYDLKISYTVYNNCN